MRRLRIILIVLSAVLLTALTSAVASADASNASPSATGPAFRPALSPASLTLPTTPSSSGTKAAANPDPKGYDECEEGSGSAQVYYFANRFHACYIGHPYIYIVEVIDGVKTIVGKWTLRWIISLSGSNAEQLMTASVRSELWSQVGVPPEPQWRLVLGIACTNTGNGKCKSNIPGGINHDIATWDLPHSFTFTFDTAASVGGGGGLHNAKDGLNYHTLTPWQNFPAGNELVQGKPVGFRCDKATYIVSKKDGGCIFSQVMATWNISLSNPDVKEVAEHIELALTKPGTGTYPPAPGGKKVLIPGFASTGHPLTRLYSNYDLTLYRANRATAVKACVAKWGIGYAQGKKYQCDEYPFASTYQGASTAKGNPWWYSVQVLKASENMAAGTSLATFLRENRILSGDQYWVAVVP